MNADQAVRETVAAQLEAGARSYGAGGAERLTAIEGVGGAFSAWHEFYTQRVLELSVAVRFDEPLIGGSGFAWSRLGMDARGAAMPDPTLLVETLRSSLREDLSEQAWDLASLALKSITGPGEPAPDPILRLRPDSGHQTEALRFLERTLSGEWREAINEIARLQREGAPTRVLYERVLLPAAVEMGTMWHLGEIGVSEEHAATEAILGAMSVLWHQADRSEPNGLRVVVGSVTDDRHSLGVRATAWLLELSGCMAACLGSDLPAPDFAQAARDYEADCVIIGATLVTHVSRTAETIAVLRRAAPGLRIIVGGPAFGVAPGLAAKVGADAMARSPGETVKLVTARSA